MLSFALSSSRKQAGATPPRTVGSTAPTIAPTGATLRWSLRPIAGSSPVIRAAHRREPRCRSSSPSARRFIPEDDQSEFEVGSSRRPAGYTLDRTDAPLPGSGRRSLRKLRGVTDAVGPPSATSTGKIRPRRRATSRVARSISRLVDLSAAQLTRKLDVNGGRAAKIPRGPYPDLRVSVAGGRVGVFRGGGTRQKPGARVSGPDRAQASTKLIQYSDRFNRGAI